MCLCCWCRGGCGEENGDTGCLLLRTGEKSHIPCSHKNPDYRCSHALLTHNRESCPSVVTRERDCQKLSLTNTPHHHARVVDDFCCRDRRRIGLLCSHRNLLLGNTSPDESTSVPSTIVHHLHKEEAADRFPKEVLWFKERRPKRDGSGS